MGFAQDSDNKQEHGTFQPSLHVLSIASVLKISTGNIIMKMREKVELYSNMRNLHNAAGIL